MEQDCQERMREEKEKGKEGVCSYLVVRDKYNIPFLLQNRILIGLLWWQTKVHEASFSSDSMIVS